MSEDIMQLKSEYGLLIGGKWVPASDGGKFKTVCAATGKVLAECAEATKEDALRMLSEIF